MRPIQFVAKTAGVSVATVSRVLNNSPLVKESTRKKVMETIKALEYEPNSLGRELRRAETRRIMVLTPSLVFPIMADVYKGIQDVAQKNGYQVLVCASEDDHDKEEELLQMLKKKIVDGVIIVASTLSAEELDQLAKDYSIVQCSEYEQVQHAYSVSVDNEQAAFDAVSHLLSLGHRRIAMVKGGNAKSSSAAREQGYRRALESAGIKVRQEWIRESDYEYQNGYDLAVEWLQAAEHPTAIFCSSDATAIGCVNGAISLGKSVPDDVAVVGFDDTVESLMSRPPITTVRQPKYDLGRAAMEALLQSLRGEAGENKTILLPHEIVIRESTARRSR